MRTPLWTQQRCSLLQAPALTANAEGTVSCCCRTGDCCMAGAEACLRCKRSPSRKPSYKRLSLRPQQGHRQGPRQIVSMMRSSLGRALAA